ncbi:hypothetical protein Hypma_000673 [Hypsizygus marmoreus]|uniref:Uncharacterized protein n=1 Tax=Hypsizygus marmoreus TaxID=39966 RepID=A0A369J6X6_HYPMA|nr:hypothetical protein Hypma_000673 [Hypsizygus marmoreus]
MATRHDQPRRDDEDRQARVSKARELIYEKGYVVNSDHVEELLKAESLVPTLNAFSKLLGQFGLDVYDLVVVDLMHELELGVWKALLLHLIRILHTQGPAAVLEFNARFRQVASFGRSTIHAFPYNVADLKKLAARDFEDILQCCIPCFEDLLPDPHNKTILDLLYLMAYFHSLAKLRMHTDSSLRVLRQVTKALGDGLRFFADETCRHFDTFETDGEYQAWNRAAARQAAKHAQSTAEASGLPPVDAPTQPPTALTQSPTVLMLPPTTPTLRPAAPSTPPAPPSTLFKPTSGKRAKTFNLKTSKAHALGDYADQVEKFGTLDSLSTILGESTHRVVKAFNSCTNRNNAIPQITSIDTRTTVHARMTQELDALLKTDHSEGEDDINPSVTEEQLSKSYHIAIVDKKNKRYLPDLVQEHREDPAFQDFVPRLKAHLLARHRNLPYTGETVTTFTTAELSEVVIQHNLIYEHATASFNFTSYDICREQDTINTNTQRCDIMLPSFEDDKNNDESGNHLY